MKIKKILFKAGELVATLLIFSPLAIIVSSKEIDGYIFWLVCSILYCIYIVKIWNKEINYNKKKEAYYKYIKNDILLPNGKSASEKEKLEFIKHFIEDMFEED